MFSLRSIKRRHAATTLAGSLLLLTGSYQQASAGTTLCVKKNGIVKLAPDGQCPGPKFTPVDVPVPVPAESTFKYKIGETGPGGGLIFYVDYHDQYPDFTYLEAAPEDLPKATGSTYEGTNWCSDVNNSIPAYQGWTPAGWPAKAVGKGPANTASILAVCTTGAANLADSYISPNGTSDWFLPSLGELTLLYQNLLAQGVPFHYQAYWSSTDDVAITAWVLRFNLGYYGTYPKDQTLNKASNGVRPIRAFE